MARTRRRTQTTAADLQAAGIAHAVGAPVDLHEVRDESPGWQCSHCGAVGHVDMIDMPARRVYFTCRDCGQVWDVPRDTLVTRR